MKKLPEAKFCRLETFIKFIYLWSFVSTLYLLVTLEILHFHHSISKAIKPPLSVSRLQNN